MSTTTLRALVTGGGGALANALTARLTHLGHHPVALTRTAEAAERIRATGAAAVAADLLDEAAVAAAVAEAERLVGPLNAVFAIAGGFATSPAADTDLSALQRALETNLFTAASAVRAALPGMLARGEGRLIGVAAAAAKRGGARMAAYAASKAALAAYLRSVDEETAPRGVSACVITPMGTIDTPANRAAMPQANPATWISTDALADAIVAAATASAQARWRELDVWPPA